MIVERTTYGRWPRPTPTNPERVEAWRRKYQRVQLEQQCAPIRKPVGLNDWLGTNPESQRTER